MRFRGFSSRFETVDPGYPNGVSILVDRTTGYRKRIALRGILVAVPAGVKVNVVEAVRGGKIHMVRSYVE